MSADDVAVVVAAAVAALAAGISVVAVVLLGRRLRDMRALVDDLRRETVPLLAGARVVVEEAATEMMRVGDVLGSAESVSATVDSASRLAYRAFANPVVKVVAYGTGAGTALRRLFGRSIPEAPAVSTVGSLPRLEVGADVAPSARRHRRRRVRQ